MDCTYYVEGELVVILDDQGDELNRIVVTPDDPNLSAYLQTAAPQASSFTEVNPPEE